jgi:hypothetical protein
MKVGNIENELLKEISENTGLKFSEKGQAIGGKYQGYNITINYCTERFYIDIPIRVTNECGVNEINGFLNYVGNKYKNITLAQYIDYNIKIQYLKEAGDDSATILILNEIVKFAKDKNLVTCCGFCGQNKYVIPFMKDKLLVPYCLDCKIQEKEVATIGGGNKTFQGPNSISGILGAMLGALIGLTVWIIIARMGNIAYVGGLVIAVATIKGCEILGNGIDKKGIIISICIIIVTVFLAQYISYAIKALDGSLRIGDLNKIIFSKTIDISTTSAYDSISFQRDLFIGYLFAIVPIAYYIRRK